MLSKEEIKSIINKDKLTEQDIFLLHYYLDSLVKLEETYISIPEDVSFYHEENLNKIIEKLESELKRMGKEKSSKKSQKNHLRLVKK